MDLLPAIGTAIQKLQGIECNEHLQSVNILNVNPNRDSPNGYPTVTPTELQPVTLAH